MSDRMIHKFADGKYTVIFEGSQLRAERHGTPWRSLSGDGMVLAMLQEVDDLKAKVEALSCREHDLLKLDTQSQTVINDLRENVDILLQSLEDLQHPSMGIPADVAEAIKGLADAARKAYEVSNVPTR